MFNEDSPVNPHEGKLGSNLSGPWCFYQSESTGPFNTLFILRLFCDEA